ncbi:uncharacterized protein LOC108598932 isoform X2 [Drosophila busckii]|uniref:uncharacterized protein LOC108598932 isoform X2 n=1 Tax=Drosophila busckii TaxID=30019 RepID=UPI00083ED5B0|nr:uncharacterized protein LOC108598932 isoform X2 [Drosophila busckii]
MDNMGISTEPSFLEVELPQTLLESPSTSTFLPDEEASICPLLSNSSILGPASLSHPLNPNHNGSDITSCNISNTDCKAETSSSDSSTGIAMDALDSTSTNLFNKDSSSCLKGNRNQSKEAPLFVSWNWPLIRKCTFFVFISGILGMCSIIVAQIATMPKHCNPKSAWYRGRVFYEINPVYYQDSNNDGKGDIVGIINSVQHLSELGISAVRLNSIFVGHDHSTDLNASFIDAIRPELGDFEDVQKLTQLLHSHNMTLLLDLPLQRLISGKPMDEVFEQVTKGLLYWSGHGVDGFYLKGLESLAHNPALPKYFATWKNIVGKDKVLIVDQSVLKHKTSSERTHLFSNIDLINMDLSIENGTQRLKEHIKHALTEMPLSEDSAWVHWSIKAPTPNVGSMDIYNTKQILATTLMQLFLPGTPNILYANEVEIAQKKEFNHETHLKHQKWLHESHNYTNAHSTESRNLQVIEQMIALRQLSPSLYKNYVCKANDKRPNTQVLPHSNADILIITRNYPRRNSFVSITNFGGQQLALDLNSHFYSGDRMLLPEGQTRKIYFKQFVINAFETIIVKLDK